MLNVGESTQRALSHFVCFANTKAALCPVGFQVTVNHGPPTTGHLFSLMVQVSPLDAYLFLFLMAPSEAAFVSAGVTDLPGLRGLIWGVLKIDL